MADLTRAVLMISAGIIGVSMAAAAHNVGALALNTSETLPEISRRDITNCPSTYTARWEACDTLVQVLADAPKFNQNSGGSNAYQYSGCYATYCDYGYGATMDSETFGTYLLDGLNTCWNQQQQRSGAAESSQYIVFTGQSIGGYVCLASKGSTPQCNC
jgi:hypothetical protein